MLAMQLRLGPIGQPKSHSHKAQSREAEAACEFTGADFSAASALPHPVTVKASKDEKHRYPGPKAPTVRT